MDIETALSLVVALARKMPIDPTEPQPGDLVFEVTSMRLHADPDAVGWLLGHDDAPYNADDPLDGSAPMREVWDIKPLNPNAELQSIGGGQIQRWENASFRRVPDVALRQVPALDALGSAA